MNTRFAAIRDALGLTGEVDFHSLRRSYITHLIEDGWDPLFVQQQVGHAYSSTTAIYTCVSSDFRTRTLRSVLDTHHDGRDADQREYTMRREVGYRWRLRELMATRGLFNTTPLAPLLAERGIELSASQVHRLVTGTPERLSPPGARRALRPARRLPQRPDRDHRAERRAHKVAAGGISAADAAGLRPKRARLRPDQ
jgi:hypothetical protein